MAKPLTIKALENLKPAGRRREVSDGGVPGLYFVIQPSGKQSWAYRYRFNGRPRKWTIGPCPAIDLKTARELAREALRKVAAGADPCTEKKAAKAAAGLSRRPGPYRNGHVAFRRATRQAETQAGDGGGNRAAS